MNLNHIKNITDVFNYYKADKISQRSMENEISRAVSGILPLSVQIDDKTSISSTNSSYLASIVPEYINGQFKVTLIIDNNMLLNKLSADELQKLLYLLKMDVQPSIKVLNDFILAHKNTEVSYLDCIAIYLKIYLNFLLRNEKTEIVSKLVREKTIDKDALGDVLLSVESGNETQEKVVEHILIEKLLPEFALQKAEDLFKSLNASGASISIDNVNIDAKPVENYWYATIASKITGTFNPETHTDLDPNYIPKSNLNR